MENKNDMSKNIIIVILVLMIIGLAGLMCYDRLVVNKEPEKTKTTEKKEEEKETTIDVSNIKAVELKLQDGKKVAITLGDNQVYLSAKKIANDIYTSLKLNNKSLFSDDTTRVNEKVYYMNDILIVTEVSTDVRGTKLHIFDKEGNKLKKIYEDLDPNATGMGIAIAQQNTFTYNNNKIIIKGTRFTHGPSVIYNNKTIDLCTNSELSDALIVEASYEIEYLGNNKLSEIKMIDGTSKTLKQAKAEYCK